ncbi:hypothetical protein [Granulicella aggregans]|nr:hypothetical protein [Granulicella aggregans]
MSSAWGAPMPKAQAASAMAEADWVLMDSVNAEIMQETTKGANGTGLGLWVLEHGSNEHSNR